MNNRPTEMDQFLTEYKEFNLCTLIFAKWPYLADFARPLGAWMSFLNRQKDIIVRTDRRSEGHSK